MRRFSISFSVLLNIQQNESYVILTQSRSFICERFPFSHLGTKQGMIPILKQSIYQWISFFHGVGDERAMQTEPITSSVHPDAVW